MNFWDSSAIVPLLVEQKLSKRCEALWQEEKGGIFVWWGSSTECVSALTRLEREDLLSAREVEQALKTLALILKSSNEIVPSDLVRERANRLLRVHPLRAGDAFQLAAAVVASEDLSSRIALVTFDARLEAAARREGFEVIS